MQEVLGEELNTGPPDLPLNTRTLALHFGNYITQIRAVTFRLALWVKLKCGDWDQGRGQAEILVWKVR